MAWWLFQNLVVTTGLALVVVFVCRTSRIGPVGRHALWLLVLVKFVTPPIVVWPWEAPDPLRVSTLDLRVDDRHEGGVWPLAASAPESSAGVSRGVASVATADGANDETPDGPPGTTTAHEFASIWPWLLGLWLAGSVALLGVEGVRLVRLWRRVRASAPVPPDLARRIARLSARLGLRPVDARVVSGAGTPAVCCLGRPRLLWPAALPADVSDTCADGLVLHELAHLKRRDHLVGWIELAAGVVWWWNPLFWFVRSALREQAELACDAWVIAALPNGRRAYAESLLALSGAAVQGTPSVAVVGIRATSRRVLERRLVMIMQGRAPLRLTRVGLLSLTLVAAATLPGWASAAQNPPPPPAPQAPVPVVVPALLPPQAPLPVVAPAQLPPKEPVPVVVPEQLPPLTVAAVPVTAQTVSPPPVPRGYILRKPVTPGAWGFLVTSDLPDDGQELVQGFETDREAIEREAEQRVEARRQELVKALEALQDRYARAGQLDEAVAIRDYLRAGLPGAGGPLMSLFSPKYGGRQP
jgi:beta-lactamase regulating signal transducer with metallopeptidase domain